MAVGKLKACHLQANEMFKEHTMLSWTNLAEPWVAVAPGGADLRGALLLTLQVHNCVPLMVSWSQILPIAFLVRIPLVLVDLVFRPGSNGQGGCVRLEGNHTRRLL